MTASHFARTVAVARLAAGLAAGLAGLPGTGGAATGCGASYTVQSGDTLAAIAERCGTSVQALMQANPAIRNPAQISIGWELTIPGDRASLGPETEVKPHARGAAAEAAVAAGTYEVRPGDSFASIATALRVPMRKLMGANVGVDPFALAPGQTLHLPDDGEVPGAEAGNAGGSEAAEGEVSDNGPGRAGAHQGTETATDTEAGMGTGDASEAGAGQAEADASEPEPDDAAERVMLEGRVERGIACPVLETPEGDTYSLLSAEYGFAPGEYVEIIGETVELSFCTEGRATVRVTSMTTVRQQGG